MDIFLDKKRDSEFDYTISPVKKDQLAFISPKAWGHEEWIINEAAYCGKKLVFKSGYRCSLHYHKIKDETWYILRGKVLVEIIDGDKKIERIMRQGDVQQIKPGIIHRISALTNSEVIEFSTHHMEEDSYRIELAGKVPADELEKWGCGLCL